MNKFGIIILSVFIISACSSTKQSRKISSSVKDAPAEQDRSESIHLYFNACKEKMLGNYDLAAGYFSQCIRKDPSNAAAMYELAGLYELIGKKEEALYFSKKAAAANPENSWYQLLLADIYIRGNNFDEAIKVYEKLAKRYPHNVDYYYEWGAAMLQAGKYDDAINVYNKIEEIIGTTEEISLQKERIYINQNKIESASEEINKLIRAFPKEVRYYGMLAELYQANGLNEKAFEIYNKLLEIDSGNALVHLSLADFYRSAGENEKSYRELKISFSKPDLNIDTKVHILLSYYTISEFSKELIEQALELCKLLTATHPEEAKSHSIYGDFLYREKKYEEARNHYRKAIELDKNKFAIWQQLLSVESELHDYEAMLAESNEAMELFPNQAVIYLFNGIANIQLKKHNEALEALNSGLKMASGDNALLSQFYSNLGETHHANNDPTASDNAFEKALDIDPANIYVLNNYSYYLSLRGKELEKAKTMAQKANEIDKNNTSFQDTYGWVLYHLGEYEEAKKWIEKALYNDGDKKGIILEHYGDVLFKLGDKEKALEFWKKAKIRGDGSKLLDKKVADKQLYE